MNSARKAAERIIAQHADLTRPERIQIAQAIRKILVPPKKRGRRPDQRVTRAVEMVKARMNWREHLPELFEGWERMADYRKRSKIKKLANAVRTRFRREKHSRK